MNVLVVNRNKQIMDALDVDVIKKIDGEFEVSELLSKFVNLYFEKLIVDITAIANYKSPEVMASFAKSVDSSRVILLLSDEPEINNNAFLANLVNNGIYNFTRNIEGIKFLYSNPNGLENVQYLLGNAASSASSQATIENDQMASQGGNNPQPQMMSMVGSGVTYGSGVANKKIIGLSNMTLHAGASTLTNMMVRQLNAHNIPAKGIEMFRQDLIYYRSPDLASCMSRIDLERQLKEYQNIPAIIIDLNDFPEATKFCNEILYLVEPSFIRLTKCIKRNKNAFVEKKNDKVVLNMSFVSEDEIYDFEIETGIKVFDNLPPINDRDTDCPEVNKLLSKLGFNI